MVSVRRYMTERISIFILSIFISSLVVFVVPRLMPGDPVQIILQQYRQQGATMEEEDLNRIIDTYKSKFGLDKDLFTQYVSYMGAILQGDLGISIVNFPRPVATLMAEYVYWTIGLMLTTVIISWVLGTLVGTFVGWKGKKAGIASRLMVAASLLVYVIPYYVFSILLLFAFAIYLRVFPTSGAYSIHVTPGWNLEFFSDVIFHAVLPSLSLVLTSFGWWFLSMRSMMLTVKDEDFIFMAEAKGLKERYIMWKYAFRNAILPQVTGLAISLGRVLGGAVMTEIVFNYPGIGSLLYASIYNLDYPLIQGCVLLLILTMCTVNLAVDLLYPFLDPRIRYGES